ncbi:MAG: hypothetical protein ACRCZY_03660 [Phocaeicola sp.]
MAIFTLRNGNEEITFKSKTLASAIKHCAKLGYEAKILICKTPTREQMFCKEPDYWEHLPFVVCSEGEIIRNIEDVVLL